MVKLNYKHLSKLLDIGALKTVKSDKFDARVKKLCHVDPSGSFASCYTDGTYAIKRYFGEPVLYSSKSNDIVFNADDVVNNLVSMTNMHHERVMFPNHFYVDDNNLLAYRTEFVNGLSLFDIALEQNDISLSDLRKLWLGAYEVAEYFSGNGFIMYDATGNNCKVKDNKLYFYDTDFFYNEPFTTTVKHDNYNIINTMFMNFIELYFFEKCFKCKTDRYLRETNNYVDDFIEELFLLVPGNCESLKEIAKHL